jgi:two-component system sensor histidine kinase TctE
MKPFKSSIRRQLLSWLVIPIIGLWLICGAVTYFIAKDLAYSAYDRDLGDSAKTVSSRLDFSGKTVAVDLPPAALAILKDGDQDEFYYQIVTPTGEILAGDSIPAPENRTELYHQPKFRDGLVNREPVRIAAMIRPVPGKPDQLVLIQIAQTLTQRTELVRKILVSVVLPEMLLIAFAAMAVFFGVSRGLAPLKVLADAVASRSQWDLSALSEDDAPKEVQPLVHAINDLLGRLQKDIEAQRRFVANAAHQLRTPLAGLKTQTQLALRRTTPEDTHHALMKIHTSADRCARLVNQLLVLARVVPGAIEGRHFGMQDLTSAARSATEELVPEAIKKGIDLGFEGPLKADGTEAVAIVYGEPLSLHELAFNLIENAVRYTQDGGNVTVRVTITETINLIIEDNGPGIPDQEHDKVFERFYRVLGTSVSGSGLGLAIVREIANALDAKVSLSSGPNGQGTCFHVQFFKPQAVASGQTALATKAIGVGG